MQLVIEDVRSIRRSSALVMSLLTMAVTFQSVSATEIGLDLVLVANPEIITGDSFDNGVYDQPPWFTIFGLPGPEAGETLALHNGDFIFQPLTTNPEASLTAFSQMQLTNFTTEKGSFAAMILFGDQPGELLSLGLVPDLAILTDGTGATMGSVALPPSSTANLLLTLDPFGNVIASVNDVPVFGGLTTGFGPVTGLGFNVVPEPATLGLLGLGCLAMGMRRLHRARD